MIGRSSTEPGGTSPHFQFVYPILLPPINPSSADHADADLAKNMGLSRFLLTTLFRARELMHHSQGNSATHWLDGVD
jgi:hypothetical protein